jgi:putative membrane protein
MPTDLDAKDRALKDRLSKLSGDAFDRAYMQEMVSDHQKVLKEFQAEAKSGRDPETKAWASKTAPTIEEHLKLATDANKAVSGATRSNTR